MTARPTWSRHQVASKICEGALLIIYRDQIINATPWAKLHPGGALALLHFVGRDATDEFEAYHSKAARARMQKMIIGKVDVDQTVGWAPLTPPIALGLMPHPDGQKGHWIKEGRVMLGNQMIKDDKGPIILQPSHLEPVESQLDRRQEKIRSEAYQELKKRVEGAGLFERPGPLAGYGSDLLRYALLATIAFGLHLR